MRTKEAVHFFVDKDGQPFDDWSPGDHLMVIRTEFRVDRGNRYSAFVDGVFIHTVVPEFTIQEG